MVSVVSSRDPNIMCHNMQTKKETALVSTESQGVRHFALSPNEKRLAYINENGGIAIYGIEKKGPEENLSSTVMESYSTGYTTKDMIRSMNEFGYKLTWYNPSTLMIPSTKGNIVALTPSEDVSAKAWSESYLHGDSFSGLKHTADVNIITFSPNRQFLASADIDGNILIWKVNSDDISESTAIRKISIEGGVPLIDLVWGQKAVDNYLLIVSSDKWQKIDSVVPSAEGHPGSSSSRVVAVESPAQAKSSSFEATAATEVAPVIFDDDISDEQFLALGDALEEREEKALHNTAPTQMMLEEEEDELLETQAEYQRPTITTSAVVAAISSMVPTAVPATEVAAPTPAATTSKSLKKTSNKNDEDDDVNFDDEPSTITKKDKAAATKSLFNDEADEVDDAEVVKDYGEQDVMEEEDYYEGDETADDGMVKAVIHELKKTNALNPQIKLQGPFQPSTTKPDERNRRYLCWNHVGNITFREDVIENRIEIRFTDSSLNRNEAFADRDGFIMGSLGFDGAAFASEADEKPLPIPGEEENEKDKKSTRGSTLLYHAFPGNNHLLGINENFRITLSDYEAIQCLAVGKGFIAVATSKKLLRIFSSTGLEVSVTWLKGPVVCMAAFNDMLAVIYHQGLPVDNSFSLAIDLISMDWENGCQGREILSQFSVPLSGTKTELDWIGFDVDGKYVTILDSAGIMSCLIHSTIGWRWVPVMNIKEVRKTQDHKYWPIMIKNNKLIYVLLNGENRPAVYPQPVVSLKQLRINQVSMRDGNQWNEQTKEKNHQLLWESLRLSHYENELLDMSKNGMMMGEEMETLQQEIEKQQVIVDKSLLASFQQACQAQHIPQAMNYALRLKQTKSLKVAITIANHFGRTSVARSLDAMYQRKVQLEQLQAQMQMGMYPGEDVAASQSQQYSQAFDDGFQEIDTSANLLSRKASMKQQPSTSFKHNAVSPDTHTESQEKPKKSLNPFAVNNSGSTPMKRGMDEVKGSPSPKKPTLNVSPFHIML